MNQAMLRYWLQGSPAVHPQEVMGDLARTLGFTILGSVPQSAAMQWWFWIEYRLHSILPSFIEEMAWQPVGTV